MFIFSMLPDVADIHYNFQTEKEILNFPFYVNFVGETFIFLRDVCKLQNAVNFDCDFPMLPDAAESIITFRIKKRF